MFETPLLERPAHRPWGLAAAYLAEVVSVSDPEKLARVQVRLLAWDGAEDQDGPIWARVAVPFAGGDRGAFLIPDVGDEVLVTFVNADPRLPVVVGGLWSGSAKPPEDLSADRVDRWTFTGKAGTRIAIVEENQQPVIELTTPGGVSATLEDAGGGKLELVAAGCTITLESSGITIQTGSTVTVKGSTLDVTAGSVNVNAAMSTFSGMVKCDVMQATTVIASTYTPGAGNIW
jgi:uncharacterized protein involved in type VI secretion and phage assembly